MRDKELYARILGIEHPWEVREVLLDDDDGSVEIRIGYSEKVALACPHCSEPSPGYDSRTRRWRHLDTCQYKTILVANVPRANCATHGVTQVAVPWAEAGSRLTALFEALVIDWLKETSTQAVARRLRMSWDEVDGVMQKAVERGLARREQHLPKRIGIDETSFQKRHEYVTVIVDQDAGTVVHVSDDRKKETLDAYFQGHSEPELSAVRTVSMDMWRPYIASVEEHVPEADSKICFDKFHVAKHLGDAVDKVRRQEHRALRAEGDDRLIRTKYLWLRNPENMSFERWTGFKALRESTLKTARAWAIKELAMSLWSYRRRGWALRAWKQWLSWAQRSRLEPVRKVAAMVKSHLTGIVNAIIHGITNARSEGINAKIQWIKFTGHGYRNRERFRTAIYFHLGGLDLYPCGIRL